MPESLTPPIGKVNPTPPPLISTVPVLMRPASRTALSMSARRRAIQPVYRVVRDRHRFVLALVGRTPPEPDRRFPPAQLSQSGSTPLNTVGRTNQPWLSPSGRPKPPRNACAPSRKPSRYSLPPGPSGGGRPSARSASWVLGAPTGIESIRRGKRVQNCIPLVARREDAGLQAAHLSRIAKGSQTQRLDAGRYRRPLERRPLICRRAPE